MKSLSILLVVALITSSLFGALISTSPNVGAVDFTPTPVVVRSTANVKESLSMGASDNGRIYVSWAERAIDNSDIMLSYSSNNGSTFSPAARVNKENAGNQRNSEVATENNELFVVWEDGLRDSGDIMLSRSGDGGLAFNETHVSNHEDGTQSYPTLAVNGSKVAIAWEEYRSDNTIRIWSGVTQGNPVKEIPGHLAAVRGVEFSPNGTYLASCSEDCMVKIWNTNTWALFKNITTHNAEVTALNWSADGKMLATGSFDHNVTLFNTTDFSIITKLNSTGGLLTKNFVNAISFSPDSSHIAVAYNGQYGTDSPTGSPALNYNLTVWDRTGYSSWTPSWTHNEYTPYVDRCTNVMDVAFSHDGAYVASGCKDSWGLTLRIWNSTTGQIFKNVTLSRTVQSVSWSPDDRFIAAGLANGEIALVNVSNILDIQWMNGSHTGGVNSIDWSTIRNEVVSGASDPEAIVWDELTKTKRLLLSGHTNSVYSVDWSSNAQYIVTAGGVSNQYGKGENQIFCAVSDDGGLTFSSPVLVSDSCSGNRLRPKIGIDPTGVISIVWYDSRSGSKIFFANSTDLGASFRKNIEINTLSGDCVIPDIFVESSGIAHVVWQFGLGAGIEYANSSNNFAQSHVIAASAQIPRIAGAPDGSALWVSWRQKNQTTLMNCTWAAVSYDGGASFADTLLLNFSNKFVGEHIFFVDRYNQTHVAWEINENPNENIYYRTSVLSDFWRPSVVSTLPANGDIDVSIFTSFTIRFSEPMKQDATEAAFSWTDGITTWVIGDCEGNQGTWNTYGDTVTFRPKIPLLYQQPSYSVKIVTTARDLAGNLLDSNLTFSFATSADIDPPKIEHFPGQGTISYDQSYNVMALVTDQWGTVDYVKLFYQDVGDITLANSVEMILTYSDTYTASIPAQLSLGTIYYFIEASDGNNIARNPVNYTNQSQMFNVSVVDGVKPEISHVRVIEAEVYKDIEIWAVVADHIQLQSVALNYRSIGSIVYTNGAMQTDVNGTLNIFRYLIPAQLNIGQIQYNITALDSSGNFNSTSMYVVQIIDRTAPIINSVKAEPIENQTRVLVRANVTDDVGVNSVVLYFKAVGGNQWVSRPMTPAEGDYYEFTIPAQSRTGTIYYYVNATDIYGNQASTLSEEDQYQVEVVGVGTDNTLYYILGGVLIVLLIVMVYLVIKKFSRPPRTSEDEESPTETEEETPEEVDEVP